MAIYNAVLTGQRVLFVGYNHSAGEVCKIVLAACALVSPPVQVCIDGVLVCWCAVLVWCGGHEAL